MATLQTRPSVFIGSSSEGKTVAEYLQLALIEHFEITVWSQGVFGLGQGTLNELIRASIDSAYAILIFTPDDVVTKRGSTQPAARDNVLFELGLFMGRLGPNRVFLVQERDANISLPTDLEGVVTARYVKRKDGNWRAALSPVAIEIRDAIIKIELAIEAPPISDIIGAFTDEDIRNIIGPVLVSLKDAISWYETFTDREMFKNVRDQILADIKRIGRRRLTFRPPSLWDHWYRLIKSLDSTKQEIRLVSNDDIKYWVEAIGDEETEAHNYALALRGFKGNKARILILPRQSLLNQEQESDIIRVVKGMISDYIRVIVVLEEDIRHPPDPFPKIWTDFGIIGDLAVSFFDWDNQEDVSRSLIESFDENDKEKAKNDWTSLLNWNRWESGPPDGKTDMGFAAWLRRYRKNASSRTSVK